MRVALIGDVGGHRDLLAGVVERLGVDVGRASIPNDLTVIQVGDLVDRGPDSAGCVELADALLHAGPGRWIQLLGNHEGNRLGGPAFWDEPLDEDAVATLRQWWDEGQARMAVALRSVDLGEVLVTHGGLTGTLWHVLGQPELPAAVAAMNGWVGTRPDLAFAPGVLLGQPGSFVGPAWPDALTELYPSWERAPIVPFGQVHGHSSICRWPSGRMHPRGSSAIRHAAEIDRADRRTRVDIGGRPFVGIDPTLGEQADEGALSAFVLEGEVIP